MAPDGTLVSVLAPTLVDDDSRAVPVYDEPRVRYGADTLLLLDAGPARSAHTDRSPPSRPG
ncbi:hypothetical protein [Streptomyces platensis]|uniref:hypothetical protein n=1 Tax=Streptomyces platensis TaxID=58346 RepID=UPI002E2564CC